MVDALLARRPCPIGRPVQYIPIEGL
jgi:hypothetical protein